MKLFWLFILLLSASAFAGDYYYQGADSRVCFNVTSHAATTANNVIVTIIPKNGTIWTGDLAAYSLNQSTPYDVFVMAENTSDVMIALRAAASSGAAGLVQGYCVYAGGPSEESLSDVAPISVDSYADLLSMPLSVSNISNISASTDGILINATGVTAARSTQSSQRHEFWMKYRIISGANNAVSWVGGGLSGNGEPIPGSAIGNMIGAYNSSSVYRAFASVTNYDSNLRTNWTIVSVKGLTSGVNNAKYYDEYNYTTLASVFSTSVNNAAQPNMTRLFHANGSVVEIDWTFAGFGNSADTTGQLWASSNYQYIINPNITIILPNNSTLYVQSDPLALTVSYQSSYSACSYALNGVNINNRTSLMAGQLTSDSLSNLQSGENTIEVNCDGFVVYRYFIVGDPGAEDLFEEAFNISIADCPTSVRVALGACTEVYHNDVYYNFSSVVCPGVSTALNYTCLGGIINVTHNNYTFFVGPTWRYGAGGVEHIGANFYYVQTPLDVGMELLSNTSFIYIPSQTKLRDCSVNYTQAGGTTCGYWGGVVINDRDVYISDRDNNWYKKAGQGIIGYNATYANTTIDVGVLLYNTANDLEPIFQGVFKRISCVVSNNLLVANITNTIPQIYIVNVTGNLSYSYTLTAYNFADSINLSNQTNVSIAIDSQSLCVWSNSTTLFLPIINLGDMESFAPFDMIKQIFMIFLVILSTVVPFAVIIGFLFNDVYHLMTVTEFAMVVMFASIGGLVINVTSFERGLKHLIILTAIFAGYITVMVGYANTVSTTTIGADRYLGFLDEFRDITTSTNLLDFATNSIFFILAFFQAVITLPLTFVMFLYDMLYLISPVIHAAAAPFRFYLELGFTGYFYFKAYEIIGNKFRSV